MRFLTDEHGTQETATCGVSKGVRSEDKDGKLSIAFGDITKIWLSKGIGFCQTIYEADIGIEKKVPKQARVTKLDDF